MSEDKYMMYALNEKHTLDYYIRYRSGIKCIRRDLLCWADTPAYDPSYCREKIWNSKITGFEERLRDMVGPDAKYSPPQLCTQEALDIVRDLLKSMLPRCRNCEHDIGG
jgi:hypothetical protein